MNVFSPKEREFFSLMIDVFAALKPELMKEEVRPQMPKVEACPFCSASANIKETNTDSGPYWRVVCSSCRASGPSTILRADVDAHDAELGAIEQWNRRA